MKSTKPGTGQVAGGIVLLEVLFVLAWNSGFVGAEYGLPYAPPLTLLFWRYLALTGVLGLYLTVRRRWARPGFGPGGRAVLVGILSHAVWLGCVLEAIDRDVPAGIVALVTALQPLVVGAVSGPVVGEPTHPRQWVGLVLGFAGVAVAVGGRLVGESPDARVAYLLPFVSVVAISAATLVQRRHERFDRSGHLPLELEMFHQSAATTLVVFLPALAFEGLQTDWTPPFVVTLVWLVLAVSLGAYVLLWRLLARTDATRVASLFYLSPPVTMLMAWFAFGDTVVRTDLLGLAVAGLGILLVHGSSSSPRG